MTVPGKKATSEVAARFTSLSDTFLDCRDPGLRHAWDRVNDYHPIETVTEKGTTNVSWFGRTEECQRCGTIKQERFRMTPREGIVKVSQKYEYPEGYLLPGIPRGVTPSSIVYQEQFNRAMRKVAKAAAGARDRER